jgi:hypothetical protein
MPPLARSRSPRVGIAVGALVVLVVLLLSHTFGRAVPTNNYRPLLTTDAIESGCYPLPGDARLDGLAYQVRWDEDVETPEGERRELRGQYDLVGRDEAMGLIVASFAEVGFAEQDRTVDGGTVEVELTRGRERVRVSAADIPGTGPDTLVRGEFRMDLPVVDVARDDPVCSDPKSTKRWSQRREDGR